MSNTPDLYTWDNLISDAKKQHDKDSESRMKRWLEVGKGLMFDINKHVEEEKFILKVNNNNVVWNLAGAGALGVIAGPPKSRKTAVTSAIEAAGLSNREILGISLELDGGRICSFDTEQKEGSFAKVKKRVHKWAGIAPSFNPPNYESYNLRELYPEQRLEFIQAHVFDPEKERPKLIIIDVVTDLLYDFNDHIKSQLLLEDIMKMAGKHAVTVLSIHLGKSGEVLGHIGSALARKVDFLLRVKKDEDDESSSVIECQLTRDVPIFPKFSITQEKGGRIYRPDLEVNSWQELKPMDVSISSSRIDDDIPF